MNKNELIPSARRLIHSLRDMGYEFASAVADLVDNSIEAGATFVAIDVEFDGDDSWVRIADNGRGMAPSELREALRYGAERDYEEEDLGKFGLGLKTASLSQCRRLTVASRTNPQRAVVAAFCWDLEHIGTTDRWEILPVGPGETGPSVRSPLKDTTGTVVLWQRLDRMLGYQLPYGLIARKRMLAMCRELESHLGMVFHRFIAGEVRSNKLKILVNGNEVTPWDPFARDEKKTKVRASAELEVEHEGIKGVVKIEPFVLPHQQDFSSPESFRRASGPANWNQQQGFYIYRAGRLIQSGGWCRLRTVDEHTKLARIAIGFNPVLDEAFKINVAKMRVQMPPQIREEVLRLLTPVIRLAQETYRKRSPDPAPAPAPAAPAPSASPPTIRPAGPSPTSPAPRPDTSLSNGPARNPDHAGDERWSLVDLQRQLEEVAEPAEKPVIARVFTRLRTRMNGKGTGR
ncbi:ATP-binding protein [Tundrisphaera lichenicola]|uniref:ATP-binding protein n=1 Tax=Tundrisphaera lichenicola TaxID=2029860 RepID=UPI003EBC241E